MLMFLEILYCTTVLWMLVILTMSMAKLYDKLCRHEELLLALLDDEPLKGPLDDIKICTGVNLQNVVEFPPPEPSRPAA